MKAKVKNTTEEDVIEAMIKDGLLCRISHDNIKNDEHSMCLSEKSRRIVEFGELSEKMQMINLYRYCLEMNEKLDNLLSLFT